MGKKSHPKNIPHDPIMTITIQDVPRDIIRLPLPPKDKNIILRPLWSDDAVARCMGQRNPQPAFTNKIDDLLACVNDNIVDFFLKSEKYNSADIEFKSSLASALSDCQTEFMNQLYKI